MNVSLLDKNYLPTKLKVVVDLLRSEGLDVDVALKGTGLVAEDVNDSSCRMSIHQLLTAFRNVSDARIRPSFPYEIGSATHVSAYGVWGYALLCSHDQRRAVRFAERYHSLAAPVCTIRFNLEPEQEGWHVRPIDHPLVDKDLHAFITCYQVGLTISLHRDIIGSDFSPKWVEIGYDRDSFYKVPRSEGFTVIDGADEIRIRIDRTSLDRPTLIGNPVTFDQFEALCRNEASMFASVSDTTGRVRNEIIRNIQRPLSLEGIAERVGMSSRTLRRHLQSENKSYRSLLADVRLELATRFLTDSSLSTAEIAEALGFSDGASFRRAFKRWTGKSTSSFRT